MPLYSHIVILFKIGELMGFLRVQLQLWLGILNSEGNILRFFDGVWQKQHFAHRRWEMIYTYHGECL